MLHTCWTLVCRFASTEQKSSLQVLLEFSNDQDHADGNVECPATDALRELLVMIAMQFAKMVHMHCMVWHKSRFTHRLHPMGLELAIMAMY
jgi:hypothetical protein